MDLLLHLCCGPCAVYPVASLRQQGHRVSGFFYNPNIHPYREFKKRLAAVRQFADRERMPVAYDNRYGLREFLRQVVFHEQERCAICYAMRLLPTVRKALEVGADAFSTTLLYSRYQKHDLIRKVAQQLADDHGVAFYYQDFRQGWQEGIDGSIAMELYRQSYCGCIYSEQERYDKKWRKEEARRRAAREEQAGVGR